jgi:hypothetical protein
MNTLVGSTAYLAMISLVIPAMMAGSPRPRCWFSGVNQFQHKEGFEALDWIG